MNVKRFTGRTAREALSLVKQAFGEDAVVLSTKPCAEGVEVLAMAPESMQQIERLSAQSARAPAPVPAPAAPAPRAPARPVAPPVADTPQQDAQALSMSTLSFQDYVRNRMLKRRQAALRAEADADSRFGPAEDSRFGPVEPHFEEPVAPSRAAAPAHPAEHVPAYPPQVQPIAAARGARELDAQRQAALAERVALRDAIESGAAQRAALADEARAALAAELRASGVLADPPVLRDAVAPSASAARAPALPMPSLADRAPLAAQPRAVAAAAEAVSRRDHEDMLRELRAMKGLIEERFGALAFMEKMQKQPRQALLTQRLLDCGFSPALVRKLADSLSPAVADEMAWVSGVLERNLPSGESEPPLEDQGGTIALVGATGVGKTTSCAKLAAAFATRHGAGQLGLITLDAYRMGAHEQLRAYGRILGVTVHTAHDRASLEDLLDLLSGKRMVLIDTAGMAQRDSRTAELLDMLGHPSIRKLLVINAAAQGETIEDVMTAYRAGQCCGVVLSKIDEAVKLAPALDALVRHRVKVLAVANGQRVPEDWHRLSAQALVQRALKATSFPAYRHDPQDVTLVFTAPAPGGTAQALAAERPAAPAVSLAARHAGDRTRP